MKRQRSPDMATDHRGTTEAVAKKFWVIRPKGLKPGNIIEFKGQRAA
jgi:hypothetical protein